MALQSLVIIALALLRVSTSYNLDTNYPIIYEIPYKHPRVSYFGMSVAIRPQAASLQNVWTIQVGAPRGDVDGVSLREPGAVYRCHTYGPCRVFVVDGAVNEVGGKGIRAYKEKKEEAWIGVSMDISGEKSVVCGNRWANQKLKNPENIDITYLMTGVCYLQELNGTSDAPAKKLLPLVNADKIYTPKPYVVDVSAYHWGLGQAGISVKLAERPCNLIVGAPGVTHWIGSVICFDPHLKTTVGNFARTEIPKKHRYTYIGYSVAAGKFYKDKKLWFVAGAPRSANYHGEVIVFQYHDVISFSLPQDSTDNVFIQSTLVGDTFGEYFGASLTTSDINGDGADDLIVGAPLYSDKDPDQGKIYVCAGSDHENFLREHQIIKGKSGRGRFGSCVASVGDLDQDGFGDVAVGAPYEDDRKGAVYVYRGGVSGLEPEYSQRIRARDICPYLRGFGISISAPVDIDGNNFEDIAVGSYLSENVVLLRSRPVILLHAKIKTDHNSLIGRRIPFFNISLCSGYTGPNAPNFTDVVRIVEVDPLHKRASLDKLNVPFSKKLIRLKLKEIYCETLTFYLDVSKTNYSPLQVIMKNDLPSCSKSGKKPLMISFKKTEEADGFLKWCPVGQRAEAFKEIAFAGICGPDHVCRSNLQLSCGVSEFINGSYTLGSSDRLVLSIEIRNLGEPAQNTKIKIWSNLKIIQQGSKHFTASALSTNTYLLDVDRTLSDSHRSNFTFRIPLEEVKEERELILSVDVSTSSTDVNLNNSQCKLSVKLHSDALFHLYSSSSQSNFFISKKTTARNILNFTHIYEVEKTGVSPVKDPELTVYIPFYFHEELLTFETETSDWLHISSRYDKSVIKESGSPLTNTTWIYKGVEENCPPINRTLFLNCSTPHNKCQVVKFYIAGGLLTSLSSYVKIFIRLNISAIDSVKKEKDIVYLSTFAVLKYREYLRSGVEEIEGKASIGLYDEERTAGVDPLVVGLSTLAGGFLLSLIVTCLAKNNFFKRFKKQELKALKESDASFIYFAPMQKVIDPAQ